MIVSRVSISGFRNISSLDLVPCPTLNFVIGANGSGKTSFLEALFVLGVGRSFRSSSIRSVVQADSTGALIYGELTGDADAVVSQGVEVGVRGKIRARKNGEAVASASKLALSFPVQLINSDTFQLLDGGPKFRRQYLDWGLFHVEHGYAEYWKRFNRAMKQRNRLLRYGKLAGLQQELKPWNEELSACAVRINDFRREHLKELAPRIEEKFKQMCLLPDLDVTYKPGWDDSVEYSDYLDVNLERDRAVGYTKNGPHRADLVIKLDGLPANDRLSRGQSKMLVCALKLVQGDMLSANADQKTTYLVDDLPSELDKDNRKIFLSQLISSKGQVFITAVEDNLIASLQPGHDLSVFHVKHGEFKHLR